MEKQDNHPWGVWSELTCQWEVYDGWFDASCDLGEITIDMGPGIRFCPGCGKPIDCDGFGGTLKAAQALRMLDERTTHPPEQEQQP